jgi:hypothetical protein
MLDPRVELLKTLRATPVVLRGLVAGSDDAQLRRRPAPGQWAIIEVVAHPEPVNLGETGQPGNC